MYVLILVTESNSTHTILNTQHVHVHPVRAHDRTRRPRGIRRVQLERGRVDAAEVQAARHLGLVEGEGERPGVQREGVQEVIWERRRVHLRDDGVVVDVRGLVEQRGAVDVQSARLEAVVGGPVTTRGVRRNHVHGAARVVEISQVNFRVGGAHGLVLHLVDEELVFVLDEEFAFLGVDETEHAVDLRGLRRGESRAALDANLHLVVRQSNQREALGPVFREEER